MTSKEQSFITFTILNGLSDAANRAINWDVKFEDFMKMAENVYWETAGCYLDAESKDILNSKKKDNEPQHAEPKQDEPLFDPKIKPIDSFKSYYAFLSNFYAGYGFYFEGEYCATAEHAFQAAKTLSKTEKLLVLSSVTPQEAKKRGRTVTLRPDWEEIKLQVMKNVLRTKFAKPALQELLLETGDAELIEGNTWNDQYWGVCHGVGENHLGKILMKIRADLKKSPG